MNGPALVREAFAAAGDAPALVHYRERLRRVLLAQDGSTTRVCEAIAGGPVGLRVARQSVTRDVPAPIGELLPGVDFIERFSTLHAHGQVMMDNLTYIAVEGLDAQLRQGLEAGTVPIGHLLERLWTRRHRLPPDRLHALAPRLWSEFGQPDEASSRAYVIVTPEGARFVIAETYRRGMLMAREAAA